MRQTLAAMESKIQLIQQRKQMIRQSFRDSFISSIKQTCESKAHNNPSQICSLPESLHQAS